MLLVVLIRFICIYNYKNEDSSSNYVLFLLKTHFIGAKCLSFL